MADEIEKLYAQIEDIETAMMVTRRRDGHLRSRAMATQRQAPGADLWFVTMEGAAKLADIEHDPHVNLSYYNSRSREWVSVSGLADISRDRATIDILYAPDWKVWFPDEGAPTDGTPDDPRMVLIGVTVHAAEFLDINKPAPVLLYEVAKGWVTGTEPDLGEMHAVGRARRPATAE